MFIDLDRFKTINDSLDHSTGDSLLCETADRLRQLVDDKGTLARLGGGEFAIFIDKMSTLEDVARSARQIVAELNQPLTIDGKSIHPGASKSIACHPRDGNTHEGLMANADFALYRAKDCGRGRFCFFDAAMGACVHRAESMATALRQALEAEMLQVFYQPKVDLDNDQLIGFGALLRWRHETLGQVPPDEILSVAEDRGLIPSIGNAVVEPIVQDCTDWLASGFDPGTIAINIHPVELRRRHHVNELLGHMKERDLALDRFILEITENCVIGRGNEEAIAALCNLRDQGLSLSLDDFSTGYASLKHLKELQLDEIKIDRSFTDAMIHDPGTAAIIKATLGLAKYLWIRVVAEGIETAEQIAHLKSLGGVVGQGYYFGRPMSAVDVKSWLQQDRQRVFLDHPIDAQISA